MIWRVETLKRHLCDALGAGVRTGPLRRGHDAIQLGQRLRPPGQHPEAEGAAGTGPGHQREGVRCGTKCPLKSSSHLGETC